jgi:choloylglycine hydrolase
VRAFIYSVSAQKYAPTVPRVELAWKFLNNFDIPPGAIMIQPGGAYAGGVGGWESTQVSCVADSKNLIYYVRNFNSLNIKKFDLMAHDLDATEAKSFAMSNTTTYEVIV